MRDMTPLEKSFVFAEKDIENMQSIINDLEGDEAEYDADLVCKKLNQIRQIYSDLKQIRDDIQDKRSEARKKLKAYKGRCQAKNNIFSYKTWYSYDLEERITIHLRGSKQGFSCDRETFNRLFDDLLVYQEEYDDKL